MTYLYDVVLTRATDTNGATVYVANADTPREALEKVLKSKPGIEDITFISITERDGEVIS